MFFVLSKTIALLLLPSNLLILAAAVGLLLLLTRWRRLGARLAGASVTLLLLIAFLPVGAWLIAPLERRFPPWTPAEGAPDGIIVLGGAISPIVSQSYGRPVVSIDGGRIIAAATLARAYPKARIVYAGGDARLGASGLPEGRFAEPLLARLGVASDRILIDSKSRNTAENAVYTKELAKPKPGERWLLVTSAFHMPRAIGCFRKVGFPVEAYPVNWRVPRRLKFGINNRFGEGLSDVDFAAHEWAGLLAYRLTGRTDALLPAP